MLNTFLQRLSLTAPSLMGSASNVELNQNADIVLLI